MQGVPHYAGLAADLRDLKRRSDPVSDENGNAQRSVLDARSLCPCGISLYDIREDVPGFVVPQMYYFIDDLPLKKYLEERLVPQGKQIKHDFSDIKSNQICIH